MVPGKTGKFAGELFPLSSSAAASDILAAGRDGSLSANETALAGGISAAMSGFFADMVSKVEDRISMEARIFIILLLKSRC